MKDTRSPIERLIDKACGYVPGTPPSWPHVTLRCPKCDKHRFVPKEDSDPKGTFRVDANCPGCAGDYQEIRYFDRQGKEITP